MLVNYFCPRKYLHSFSNLKMPSKGKGIYCTYDRVKLSQALAAVRSGRVSACQAAQDYGIPRSTLGDRIRGDVLDDATTGKSTALLL